MGDYRLARTQQNEVHQLAVALGLDTAAFEWLEQVNRSGDPIHRIDHRPTGAYLEIDHVTGYNYSGYIFRFWPNTLPDVSNAYDWPDIKQTISDWLDAVKRESDAPDLWAESAKERQIAAAAASAGNELFNPDERRLLAESLNEIEAYVVATYDVAEEQRDFVKGQFDYLRGAVDRLGKRDWLNVLRSTLISLALNQVVTNDAVPNILRFAWTAIQIVFGIPLELPPVAPPAG